MIDVCKVAKRFGKVVALDELSARVHTGARVGLIGTNGSGKTTLLRAICGLVRVQGTVAIDGIDVARDPRRALAGLAYVPQVAPPLEAPIGELVRAYCSLRAIAPEAVRERAGRLGCNLDELLASRARDLSGGMKQKLLLALALSTEAPILLCDEPTASLDPAARDTLLSMLRERAEHTTLLVCSHRVEEIRGLVDRVIEMREGRIVRDEALSSRPLELVRSFAAAPDRSEELTVTRRIR